MAEGQLIESKIALPIKWSPQSYNKNFVLSEQGITKNLSPPARQDDIKHDTEIAVVGHQNGAPQVTSVLWTKGSRVWQDLLRLCISGHRNVFTKYSKVELQEDDITGVFAAFTLTEGTRHTTSFLPKREKFPAHVFNFITAKPKHVKCQCGCNSPGHIASITAVLRSDIYKRLTNSEDFRALPHLKALPFKGDFISKLGRNPTSQMLHLARVESTLYLQRTYYSVLSKRCKDLEKETEAPVLAQQTPRKRPRIDSFQNDIHSIRGSVISDAAKDQEIAKLKELLLEAEATYKASEERAETERMVKEAKAAVEREQLADEVRNLKIDVEQKRRQDLRSSQDHRQQARSAQQYATIPKNVNTLKDKDAEIEYHVNTIRGQSKKIFDLSKEIEELEASLAAGQGSWNANAATIEFARVIAEQKTQLDACEKEVTAVLRDNTQLAQEVKRLRKQVEGYDKALVRHIRQRRDCVCGAYQRKRVFDDWEDDWDEDFEQYVNRVRAI